MAHTTTTPSTTNVATTAPAALNPATGNRVIDQARDALAAFVRNAPAGSKLPPERELAQRLGVSRTTLRDGVSRLELLGLLEVRHGDGTYVRSPDAAHLALPFHSLVELQPRNYSELLTLNELLAPALAAAAANNADDHQIAAMRAAIHQERSALTARPHRSRRTAPRRTLEELIVEASGQSLVGILVGLATELLKPAITERLPGGLRQLAVEQRAAIVEAIAIGEPDAARGAMQLHLRTLSKALGAQEQPQPA